MRSAEALLAVIQDRGRRGLPLRGVYRQLYNPALYLAAYGKIAKNAGALTPGVTPETADGMSLAKIEAIIAALRQERYRWTPARRVYIEKKRSKQKRPLGVPTWTDKLLHEALRLILEAYYEPQFSPRSHGFRPPRGCHTALTEIQRTWRGTVWFIEGDISRCFDRLDHDVLLAILREKIHDNRFLRLIENLLKAGYLEDWRYHATLSGCPQGGVVSPVLANIYLDRLDKFAESTLLPAYTRGDRRANNPAYYLRLSKAQQLARRGHKKDARRLRREAQQFPVALPDDPAYRRLRYNRYADDFLLGFAGPRSEAEAIKRQLGDFLRDHLKLELSDDKTRITHARTEAARYLGYEIARLHNDRKHRGHRRSINGGIGLKVPRDAVRAKCRHYLHRGKPVHHTQRTHDAVFTIVARYQDEYRGFAEYYQLAFNRSTRISRLKWVMEQSLTKTLASKLKISVSQVYRRFQAVIRTDRGTYKGLRVTIQRDGKKPLVAQWGGISLARQRRTGVLNDQPSFVPDHRVELVERLLAATCEQCGSSEQVQVHHVRHLRDLNRAGRAEPPAWVKRMAAHRRKTLVVCHTCHAAIHAGQPARHRSRTRDTGEPDAGKLARPVRRGADGKVPA
jgi:group II intron reverse transcriptase/maturase